MPQNTTIVLKPKQRWTTLLNEVVQVRVNNSYNTFDIFIKIERDYGPNQSLEQEFKKTRMFRKFFVSSEPKFDSVEAISYSKERTPAIVFRGCKGKSLFEAINASCRWLSLSSRLKETLKKAEAVGQWLRYLETSSANTTDPISTWEELLAHAKAAKQRIRAMGLFGSNEAAIDDCRQIIESAESQAASYKTYMAHGDFHPENIFVTEGPIRCVTTIDLMLSQPRFVGYDALYFEHNLIHNFGPYRYRPSRIRAVLKAFKRGYGWDIDLGSKVVHSIRAHFVLRSFVYLSTIAMESSRIYKWIGKAEIRKLHRWLNKS